MAVAQHVVVQVLDANPRCLSSLSCIYNNAGNYPKHRNLFKAQRIVQEFPTPATRSPKAIQPCDRGALGHQVAKSQETGSCDRI